MVNFAGYNITAKKAWYDHLISLVAQINFFGAKSVCVIACMVVYGWQKYALSVEDVRNNCKRVGTAHTPQTKKFIDVWQH